MDQLAEGRALVEEDLALAWSLDDHAGIANGVHNLALIAVIQGDLEAARRWHAEGLDIQHSFHVPQFA